MATAGLAPRSAAADPGRPLVLRLQRMLDNGCGQPVQRDGIMGPRTLRAMRACGERWQLPIAIADPDSATVAAFLEAAWQRKLERIVARQLDPVRRSVRRAAAAAETPDDLLQHYRDRAPLSSLVGRTRQEGLPAAGVDVYLQVFKREQQLEVYARRRGTQDAYRFLKAFPITASPFTYPDSAAWMRRSSPLPLAGPKVGEGDGRVPEGCYLLTWANRWSRFHLAFAVSYPNGADLARRQAWGATGTAGGGIAVHGGQASVGCIPLGDPAVEELFLFLYGNGHREGRYARIDIFPGRLADGDGEGDDDGLAYYQRHRRELTSLWASLRTVQEQFARTGRPPPVSWDADGSYRPSR